MEPWNQHHIYTTLAKMTFWYFLVVGFYEFLLHSIIGIKPPYHLWNLRIQWCYRAYLAIWWASQKFGGDLALFQPLVCVCRAQYPAHRALGMHCACGKFELRAGSVCTVPSVCAAPLSICVALLQTASNSLKHSRCTLTPFATFLQGLD